ncbi:50S ribosomal protein L28 [Candidatus Dependentiae bacterium]|nr:50S ribosomal protein L28 [Candidatus Dependentiae bacterium]
MSRICFVCDKKPAVANMVSHAKNRTKKWVYPNVHKVRFTLANSGSSKVHHESVCAKCLKAGKIKKIV